MATNDFFLFSSSLLLHSDLIKSSDLVMRPLHINDYEKGFLDLLGQLTVQGIHTRESFHERFRQMKALQNTYFILVVEDLVDSVVVATASLFLEHKFLRSNGSVGHIEDVVVRRDQRGKNLGIGLIKPLLKLANDLGCYKVILNCSDDNIPFYEKCGFSRKEVGMACYFQSKTTSRV